MTKASPIAFNLLVLRCHDIEVTRVFYEKLRLSFRKEKHGNGVEHYSTQLADLVLEFYPATTQSPVDHCRLGVCFNTHLTREELNLKVISSYRYDDRDILIVEDPDGRKIELS